MKRSNLLTFLRSLIREPVRTLLVRVIVGANLKDMVWHVIINQTIECKISKKSRLYSPYYWDKVTIGDYSYVAKNSRISRTHIGRFCSIGTNFLCGGGVHPTNGISTSPYFYSINKQNGATLSTYNKVKEREWITIGNDVFIGMNVTVLDGVTIGDGAVIGAGAVVSKDIPPYAIAVGCPIRIKGYRFDEKIINDLLMIKWWEKDDEYLKMIESMFFEVEEFISAVKIKDAFHNANYTPPTSTS